MTPEDRKKLEDDPAGYARDLVLACLFPATREEAEAKLKDEAYTIVGELRQQLEIATPKRVTLRVGAAERTPLTVRLGMVLTEVGVSLRREFPTGCAPVSMPLISYSLTVETQWSVVDRSSARWITFKQVADRTLHDHKHHETIVSVERWCETRAGAPPKIVRELLLESCSKAMLHEVDENLLLDDMRITDPHKEPTT